MNLTSSWPRLAALLCAGFLALAAAGCGGDDDNGGNDFSDQPQAEQEQQKEAAAFVATFVDTARSGNAKKFCELFEPGARDETFGSAKVCVDTFKPLLRRSKIRAKYEISDIKFDGDKATVTFEGGQGQGDLEKVDGKWYVAIPDELVKQVEELQG